MTHKDEWHIPEEYWEDRYEEVSHARKLDAKISDMSEMLILSCFIKTDQDRLDFINSLMEIVEFDMVMPSGMKLLDVDGIEVVTQLIFKMANELEDTGMLGLASQWQEIMDTYIKENL